MTTHIRIGALDVAIANLLGSNMFNIAILAFDDLIFLPGPLLSYSSPIHAVSALSATIMTGIFMIGLIHQPKTRPFIKNSVASEPSFKTNRAVVVYFLSSHAP